MIDLSGTKELTIDGVRLREMSVDGTKIWQAGRLPAGYTEVEYIILDGNCWFDTKVNAYDYNDKVLRYHFKGQPTGFLVSTGNNYLFGCLNNGQRSGNVALRGDAVNKTSVYIGGATGLAFNCDYMPVRGEDFEVIFYGNSTARNISGGTMIDNDGTSHNFKYSAMTLSDMPNANIYLGHCNGTTTGSSKGFKGKVKPFYIDTEDGIPVLGYAPCIRNSDGEPGMFDLITGRFDGNAGTGTLTAGPAV